MHGGGGIVRNGLHDEAAAAVEATASACGGGSDGKCMRRRRRRLTSAWLVRRSGGFPNMAEPALIAMIAVLQHCTAYPDNLPTAQDATGHGHLCGIERAMSLKPIKPTTVQWKRQLGLAVVKRKATTRQRHGVAAGTVD